MKKKLIIFGTGLTSQVTSCYFDEYSEYEVVAFTINKSHIKQNELLGIPVVPFEDISLNYPPDSYHVFIGTGFGKLNQIKLKIYNEFKSLDYKFATFVHPNVKIWKSNKIGENTFIFEDNTIQPFVEIGIGNIIWSGNHIGHHSKIGSNCFISSHCVISGSVIIGDLCYIGVNATIRDSVKIEDRNIIGAGALILKSTKVGQIYPVKATKSINVDSKNISI